VRVRVSPFAPPLWWPKTDTHDTHHERWSIKQL